MTLPNTVIECLTFTFPTIPFVGLKINVLVILFLIWAIVYWGLKNQKRYTQLTTASKALAAFSEKLKEPLSGDRDLREDMSDYFQETAQVLNGHSADMATLLFHAWQEFAEGIQDYPLGSGQLANTYQADDFFTVEGIIKPFTLPLSHTGGLYTAVGLLCTFIALGAGMSSLLYSETTGKIDGLDSFINALSGKFLTSIMGLGFALSIDGLIRKEEHAMEADLAEVVYRLNRRVKRLTSQSILTQMNSSVQALPGEIEAFLRKSHQDDGLMAQLKDTIESSLKGLLDEHVTEIRADLSAISTNLSGFGDNGAAQLTEVMMKLGPELKEAISSGVSGDISQLTATLEQLPKVMEASQANLDKMQHTMAEGQAMMIQSIKDVLANVTSQSQGQLEGVLQQLNVNSARFQEQMLAYQQQQQEKNGESLQALTQLLAALKDRQVEQSNQLDSSMAKAIERLEDSLSQSQVKTNTEFTALQTSNAQLLAQMQTALTQAGSQASQQMQEQQAITSQTLDSQRLVMGDELKAVMEAQRQAQEAMVTGVQQLFETQAATLNPLLEGLKQSFKGFEAVGETLPHRVRETEQAIATAMDSLKTFMNEQMAPFITQASQLTQEQQRLNLDNAGQFGQLQTLQSGLLEGQSALATLATQLTRLQTDITQSTLETNGTLSRNGELVAGCIEQLNQTRTTLDTEYERLHTLSKSIAGVYAEAGGSMTGAIKTMQTTATAFYGDLGTETRNLTTSLQTAISSVSGAMRDFEDALESFKGKQ